MIWEIGLMLLVAIVGWTWVQLIYPSFRYGLPIAWLSFFVMGVIHEFGHGLANGLTGGTYGFTSTMGNIIGGYGLQNVYAGIMPVFYVNLETVGDWGWMLLGGPWIVILIMIGLVRLWNWERFEGTDNEPWWTFARFVVAGVIVRAWADAIYLLPIDVFPADRAHANGDGMALYNYWQSIGWDFSTETFALNFQYIVGLVALILVVYHTWYWIKRSRVINQ